MYLSRLAGLAKANIWKLQSVVPRDRKIQKALSKLKFKISTPSGQCVKRTALTFTCCTGLSLKLLRPAHCENLNHSIQPVKIQIKNISWWTLFLILLEDIFSILAAITAAVGVAYLNVLIPLKLGDVINAMSQLLKNESNLSVSQLLSRPVTELVGLYIAQAAGTAIYISILSNVGENVAVKLKNKLFSAIISQDLAFFDTTRTGALLECITSDVQEFKHAFKICISQGLRSAAQIGGCVVSLYILSPIMTLAVLGVIPSVIICGTLCGRLLRNLSKRAQLQAVKVTSFCEETLSNIRTVRSFANEERECRKFEDLLEESKELNIVLGYGIGAFQGATNFFLNGIVLASLCFGSHLMSLDKISPGNMMSFLVASQTIQRSFAQLSLLFGNVIKGKEACQRILHYCSLKPNIPLKGGKKIGYHAFVPVVEFKDVTFSYPTRPEQVVLNKLNLTLPAGKTVAIVGASGNGKSTIAALLERFYDVDSGSLLVGGVNIKELDPSWLRGEVLAIITQEPILFATSIKENIRYGNPKASDEEVYEAARQANADGFIREFPEGYDTTLGERGVTVSGGQKQRIAIARALIKKPSILILDEATSALDSESEKIVQMTLEKICLRKTVLVIAHRLSTVKNADIIVVLEKGAIIEMGSHHDLLAKKGAYFHLMNQETSSKRNKG